MSMREILFKAKRIYDGKWIEGLLWKKKYNSNKIFISYFPDGDDNEEAYAVDSKTICQYTGLTDKRGNKIWENDVVKCVDVNIEAEFFAVVEFGNPNGFYSWGYQLKHIWGDEPNLDILLWIDMEETGATCEVIGNIFDNPELMNTTETIGYADNDCLMPAT